MNNIKRLYLIKTFRNFLTVIPIVVLYFQSDGLSLTEVFLLQSCFALAVILLEVPSGYFSDRFGRKKSLVLGVCFGFFGDLFMLLSKNFPEYLVAEVFLALGMSFISGSDFALLYDSLEERGEQSQFVSVSGKMQGLAHFSEGIGALLGGVIASVLQNLEYALYPQIAASFLCIPVAFGLKEGKGSDIKARIPMGKIIRESFSNPSVSSLLLFSGLLNTITLCAAWLAQPYFKWVGLPIWLFGFCWSGFHLFSGYISSKAEVLKSWLGTHRVLILCVPICSISFLLLGWVPGLFSIAFFLLFQGVRGAANPLILFEINERISMDRRATVLSIQSLLARLGFSMLGPLAGKGFDTLGEGETLLWMGGIFLICSIPSGYFLKVLLTANKETTESV